MSNNSSEYKDFVRVEEELVEEFVKANPYPGYEKILEKIGESIERSYKKGWISNSFYERYLNLYSEYGELQHICCKIIYEHPRNKDLIVKIGKKIYGLGGFQALSATHDIIKYFSPYAESKHIFIRMQGRMIEEYFQDVCEEWKA